MEGDGLVYAVLVRPGILLCEGIEGCASGALVGILLSSALTEATEALAGSLLRLLLTVCVGGTEAAESTRGVRCATAKWIARGRCGGAERVRGGRV